MREPNVFPERGNHPLPGIRASRVSKSRLGLVAALFTGLVGLPYALGQDKGAIARETAVEGTTDQTLLAKIALKDKSAAVRDAAVKRLTDQNLLVKVAIVRESQAAVERLTDQSMLAKVALESKWGDLRRTAINKLTDQSLLARVALDDTTCSQQKNAQEFCRRSWDDKKPPYQRYDDVRTIAVARLADQAVLAKLSLGDRSVDVRKTATERLIDQASLAKVALQDQSADIREAAVNRLTDQELLAEVAVAGNDSVRLAATEKVTDQSVLAGLAVRDKDYQVRRAAVKRLTDRTTLTTLLLADDNRGVRHDAVERLRGFALPFPRPFRIDEQMEIVTPPGRFPVDHTRANLSSDGAQTRGGPSIKEAGLNCPAVSHDEQCATISLPGDEATLVSGALTGAGSPPVWDRLWGFIVSDWEG